MAQSIDEQMAVIERALGERMIDTALVAVRSWMNELGENNPYEEAYERIRKEYHAVFKEWLSVDKEGADEELSRLTGDAYQLVDAVYAEIRLKRGVSPQMHGFNGENPQSIMHYFQNCVRLRPEDLEWLHEVMYDDGRASAALLAITSLTRNVRQCFSIDAFMALIDGINSPNEVVSDQCISNVLTLLIQYDVRIDFFPQIQDAFVKAIEELDDIGAHVFEVLCALIESTQKKWLELYAQGLMTTAMLPKELQKLIETSGLEHEINTLMQWLPKSETEYVVGLIQILPDTWLYALLVEGDAQKERTLAYVAVSAGYRDMMWNYPEVAVKAYRDALRKGAKMPIDYINYAHCLLLNGDRITAYEYYLQARKLCESSKDFFALFRPDRRALVDHGIPIEQVYLLEDQLLTV